VVWTRKVQHRQGRSGTKVLESEHEERRRRRFFLIEAKKNKYVRTSTIEGTKKNEFICS
jgi:hypothetical protein